MDTRKSKEIKDQKLISTLLDIKEEDVTNSFIMEIFGHFEGKETYNPYDLINIPAKTYGKGNKKNKEAFKTTVGLCIFNK